MRLRFLPALLLVFSLPALARDPSLARWRDVAGRLISTSPESYPFNWGEGVQMIGLMKVYERTRDARYADYMERWVARFPSAEVDRILREGIPGETQRGYCGHWSPATAILYLHQARPRPEYRQASDAVLRFIRREPERSGEGALGHWQGNHQLWVDTLYMACPLYTAYGAPGEAARQILLYARRLQDETTGLFYHMWDWRTGKRSPELWGRGNGWVLMSIADTLDALPKSDPRYGELQAVARRMAVGLRQSQDTSGLWHTVLDDHTTYAECSATSMVVYGLLKLVRYGVLPASERAPALKAWQAVNERYVKDGLVTGVSAGTGPGDRAQYSLRPVGVETWGTGAYLMAGSEVDRLR